VLNGLFCACLGFSGTAFAMDSYTHNARVEITLSEINEKGETKRIENRTGDLILNWETNRCELWFRKDMYPCQFNRTEDLINSKNELVMKSIPQAWFDRQQIDFMMIYLSVKGDYSIRNFSSVLVDSGKTRGSVMKLPFYDCVDCENNGKNLQLRNAYYGSVERSQTLSHAELGKKKIVFSMKVKKMEANKAAFYIIGSDNSDRYGQ